MIAAINRRAYFLEREKQQHSKKGGGPIEKQQLHWKRGGPFFSRLGLFLRDYCKHLKGETFFLVPTCTSLWLSILSLVPRLFLVEERAWQHWGVRAVYFRYVMVHVIYSNRALFLKIIMWFLRGHIVRLFKRFSKKTEKSSTVTRHQVNHINKTDHTIAAWSPKAGKNLLT